MTLTIKDEYRINYGQSPSVVPTVILKWVDRKEGQEWATADVHSFPLQPRAAVTPVEMCSTKREGGNLSLVCLNDEGDPVPVELTPGSRSGDPGSRSSGGPSAECARFDDRIGERDLEPVRREWKDTGCAPPSGRAQRVRVVLDLRGGGRWPFHVRAKLFVPSLGLARGLGTAYECMGTATARRSQSPPGLVYACSDDGQSLVTVYQSGRRLFYRVARPEDAPGRTDLQSDDLPCGAVADFSIESDYRVYWGE